MAHPSSAEAHFVDIFSANFTAPPAPINHNAKLPVAHAPLARGTVKSATSAPLNRATETQEVSQKTTKGVVNTKNMQMKSAQPQTASALQGADSPLPPAQPKSSATALPLRSSQESLSIKMNPPPQPHMARAGSFAETWIDLHKALARMYTAWKNKRRLSAYQNRSTQILLWMTTIFLIFGGTLFVAGALNYWNGRIQTVASAPLPEAKVETKSNPSAHTSNRPSLAASVMTIPTASAAIGKPAPSPLLAVFPYPWQRLISRLEQKQYAIEFTQTLHPRLYLIQLARGVEINLLLSQDEKFVEELNVRIHILDAHQAVPTYRQIMADFQDLLADGVLRADSDYFNKLNLPLNLYAVPLPYSVSHEYRNLRVELQILDPIYINLRYLPLRAPAPLADLNQPSHP